VVKDLFSVAGKVALVTGGSQGIGKMIATGYVENGVKTYISSRKKDALDKAEAELSQSGTCIALQADCSTEAGCNSLAAAFAEREPALHILVNNAGANWGAPFAEFPDSGWDRVLNLNVKGVFHLTRALVPQLEKGAKPGDPGRVINIGSIDGLRVPLLDTFSYSASKAAVHHMTRVLAHHLAPKNITVNAVAPGPFESDDGGDARSLPQAIVASSMGRIGEPEDMAGVAIYWRRAPARISQGRSPSTGNFGQTLRSFRGVQSLDLEPRSRMKILSPKLAASPGDHGGVAALYTVAGF
jgi:NAD(P)-dependent dehydrogenase (short-subunit alcohol dehydrogenase family)